MSNRIERDRGFTIVELLVVIGVIGAIIALLFPALIAVGRTARKTESMNNMRQINLWMNSYSSDNNDFILPSQFDYSDPALNPYPGKVRSLPSKPAGLTLWKPPSDPSSTEHIGTWTDILWTINNLARPLQQLLSAQEALGHNYQFDSPTKEVYQYFDDRIPNPLRSASFNTDTALTADVFKPFGNGADEENMPGFFAANDFFNARPDVPGSPSLGNWYTNGQMKVPDRSLYLVDSLAGEVISPDEVSYYNRDPNAIFDGSAIGGPPRTCEVDFRYNGTCLMLFLDGHLQDVGPWVDLSDLQEIRRFNITNPLASTP